MNIKTYLSGYGPDYGINSRVNPNSWSSSYGLDAPGADRRLRSIRDQADSVLKRVAHGTEQKSLAWKCIVCGHTKHFTRPASDGKSDHSVELRLE